MTKKRSKEAMIEAILKEARAPEATVRRVGAGFDWNSWKALSGALIKAGLLSKRNGYYQTTDRGLLWLSLRERQKALVEI